MLKKENDSITAKNIKNTEMIWKNINSHTRRYLEVLYY